MFIKYLLSAEFYAKSLYCLLSPNLYFHQYSKSHLKTEKQHLEMWGGLSYIVSKEEVRIQTQDWYHPASGCIWK